MASVLPLLCYLLLVFSYCCNMPVSAAEANKTEIDRQSLLCFMSGIYYDPLGVLNAWLDSSLSFCSWPGVSCSTELPARVVSLNLTSANLGGQISGCIANLTSLSQIHLSDNGLSGPIPDELGKIPGLHTLMLAGNHLEGIIPDSLASSSSLSVLILSRNNLTGVIPSTLFANSSALTTLDLQVNSLTGIIPPFDKVINLKYLCLTENLFSGSIPPSIGNVSSLRYILLGSNQITGTIPIEISNLINLTELSLENNLLSGSIPSTMGKLQGLFILKLSKNKISGEIPSTVGNITQLGKLFLDDNNFSGNIPSSLDQCMWLLQLNLSVNKLDGFIPQELFIGPPIPLGVDLSHNNLIGPIPFALGNCFDLSSLRIEGNKLHGPIPESFKFLLSIQYINLSQNDLSGNVPEFFGNLTMLEQLDLSYNNFEGQIPTSGIFANSSRVHLDGNKRLCSDISMLALLPCHGSSDTKTKNHKNHALFPSGVLAALVSSAVTLALLFCLFTLWKKMELHISSLNSNIWYLLNDVTHWITGQVCTFSQFIRRWNMFQFVTYWRRREIEMIPSYQETLKKVSYVDIVKATKWFSPVNRISSTSTGSVYVGRFQFDNDLVAIKVFNLNYRGAHHSYLTECEVLRSIRHQNILKSVTLCSTLDTENNEFKALVFQFMVNGSLERWLHPKQQTDKPKRTLSLGRRICIATDVASALDYLHNQLIPPLVVHCDLKPSNVLLDYDMTARVGDFGSARFLSQDSGGLNHFVSIQGTIGYLAPEYGIGYGASTEGDVYSFGVLLLEMLTGMRPTDDMFVDGLSLHSFADSMFPGRVEEILDPNMGHEERKLCAEVWMHSYIIPLVALGLSCSVLCPKDRPGMKDVCAKLSAIKEAFLESSD